MPATISGFAVIPVSYDPSTTHYLYARPHSSSKGKRKANQTTLPDGRTLFLVNVPPDATERELVLFFKHAGTVEKVVFGNETQDEEAAAADDDSSGDDEDIVMKDPDGTVDESPILKSRIKGKKTKQDDIPEVIPLPSPPLRKLRKTGLTAHVVFLDVSSLERALASTSKPRAWPFSASSSSAGEPCGLAHYQALYASLRPPLDSVKAFADSAMEVYEYNVQKEKQKSKYKKGEAIVDEDGFTLVTRGGAYGKTLGGGVGVASKKFQRSAGQARSRTQKKEKKEKEGFYSFQKADKQRAGSFFVFCDFHFCSWHICRIELFELKRKWEEDKARVEKLKASRRFKPY